MSVAADENGLMAPGERHALERVIDARYSCRSYLAKPVPRETIEQILATSQKSASWCNSQAWALLITEGQGTERFRAALSAHAAQKMADRTIPVDASDIPVPERYAGIYRERRRECGFQLYDSLGIAHDDRAGSAREMLKNFSFFGAPHAAVITTPRDLGTYGAVDCGGFISTFLIVARAHGVASIAQGAIAIYSSFVRDYFNIPDDRLILCGMSFGFEDLSNSVNRFRTSRAPLSEVVKWISA